MFVICHLSINSQTPCVVGYSVNSLLDLNLHLIPVNESVYDCICKGKTLLPVLWWLCTYKSKS